MDRPGDLPAYIIDQSVIDSLLKSSDLALDRFLRSQYTSIRRHYYATGQPSSVLKALDSLNRRLEGSDLPESVSRAKLLAFEAEMWIARGASAEELRFAEDLSARAAAMALGSAVPTTECFDVVDESWLLYSVALKAQGQADGALTTIDMAHREARLVDVEASLIGVRRQAVLIHQNLSEHLDLLDDVNAYRIDRPVEHFRTLKRVFEYLLNNGYHREAEALVPELVGSYRRVEYRLTPISRLSFAKNMGQLMIYRGRSATGVDILNAARVLAVQFGFSGQVRQIDGLLRDAPSRQNNSLTTFLLPE